MGRLFAFLNHISSGYFRFKYTRMNSRLERSLNWVMMDENGPGFQIKTQFISGTTFCGNIRSFPHGWVRHFAPANIWRNADADTQSNGYADPEPSCYRQALCIE